MSPGFVERIVLVCLPGGQLGKMLNCVSDGASGSHQLFRVKGGRLPVISRKHYASNAALRHPANSSIDPLRTTQIVSKFAQLFSETVEKGAE